MSSWEPLHEPVLRSLGRLGNPLPSSFRSAHQRRLGESRLLCPPDLNNHHCVHLQSRSRASTKFRLTNSSRSSLLRRILRPNRTKGILFWNTHALTVWMLSLSCSAPSFKVSKLDISIPPVRSYLPINTFQKQYQYVSVCTYKHNSLLRYNP